MKLSRKLLPAIAMLLVSAVMMSTASFAWFSTNSTATANGMTVSVSAARNITITEVKDGVKGAYSSLANLNSEVGKMTPGSTAKGTDPAFFYVSDSKGIDPGNYAPKLNETAFAAAAADGTTTAGDVVYVKKTVSLMATGAYESGTDHGNVEATFEVTGGVTSPVAESLRVMLVVYSEETPATKTAYVFAPIGTAEAYKPIIKEGVYAEASLGTEITPDVNGTDIIEKIRADKAWTVDIYYWFEGQDTACTAANAIDISGIIVTIKFSFATA